MTKMITLKKHRFGSAEKKPGDRYEIPSSSAEKLYRALGLVGDAPPEEPAAPTPAPATPQQHTRAMKAPAAEIDAAPAEPAAEPVAAPAEPASPIATAADIPGQPAPAAKRAYRRRDLTAE